MFDIGFRHSTMSKVAIPYPTLEEFMEALQDEGKSDKKNTNVIIFPMIRVLAAKIYKAIATDDFFTGIKLPANDTRGRNMIYTSLIMHRKHGEVITALPKLKNLIKLTPTQTNFYYIANQDDGGLQVVKNFLKTQLSHSAKNQSVNRASNDALRLVGIFLLPENRMTMKGILSGKNDRLKQDQAVNPTLSFAQEVAKQFNDTSLKIENPKNKDQLEGEEDMDPNDEERILNKRNGAWVMDTWIKYIKPKYKEALHRWSKETGGGDGSSVSFQRYCSTNGWLGWVYLKDEETSFLLASASDPNVPTNMRNEPGFENLDGLIARTHRSGNRIEQSLHNLEATNAARNESIATMNTAFSDLLGFLHKKAEQINDTPAASKRKTAPGSPSDFLWKKLEELNNRHKKLKTDGEALGYSPSTLKSCLAVVSKQQNDTLKLIVQRGENKFVTPTTKGDFLHCTEEGESI